MFFLCFSGCHLFMQMTRWASLPSWYESVQGLLAAFLPFVAAVDETNADCFCDSALSPCRAAHLTHISHKCLLLHHTQLHCSILSNSESAVEFSNTILMSLCCQSVGKYHWHSSTTQALIMDTFSFLWFLNM